MRLTEVLQRELEAYEAILLERAEKAKSAAAFNRVVIEAAVEAGFAHDVPDDLLALRPYEVAEMSRAIVEHVNEAKRGPTEGES